MSSLTGTTSITPSSTVKMPQGSEREKQLLRELIIALRYNLFWREESIETFKRKLTQIPEGDKAQKADRLQEMHACLASMEGDSTTLRDLINLRVAELQELEGSTELQ
ncbi:hypothetical protein CC79DRAFT_1369202 [Sarocladium strictum]